MNLYIHVSVKQTNSDSHTILSHRYRIIRDNMDICQDDDIRPETL